MPLPRIKMHFTVFRLAAVFNNSLAGRSAQAVDGGDEGG